MTKTQIYLTDLQSNGLNSLVAETGKKQDELIAQAIDELLQSQKKKNWKEALRPLQGIWENRDDLPDFEVIRQEADRNKKEVKTTTSLMALD